MDRVGGFLERRRWFVLGAWVALLVAAAPFAARQQDHLTAGGFDVPGSGSEVADRNLERFDHARSETLAVVLARRPGATAAGVRSEIDRIDRIAARRAHVELPASAARRAKRQAGGASIVVVPLDVAGNMNQTADL